MIDFSFAFMLLVLSGTVKSSLREDIKYYFADFVRKGDTPPPFTDKFVAKKNIGLRGYPPRPHTPPPLCTV